VRVLLVNDTRIVGHHGSSSVVDVIFQEFARRGMSVVSDVEHGIDIRSLGDHGCQAVVINGEGAMHGGGKHSHLFSRIGEQMHQRGIPVFLINTVFNERTPEIVARMRYFTGIYCRETQSANLLGAAGVDARVCPDLTFGLDLPDGLAFRPGSRIVVLDTTVASKNRTLYRFCLENGLQFQPMRASPRLVRATSYRNLLRIARFSATKYAGKLLPGVYAFGRYANAVTSSRAFFERMTDETLVVVASRFHGVCFCIKAGVPFLAISSNTPKIEGMLADAGLSHRMLDMADLNLDAIRSRCAWSPSDEERRKHYVNNAKVRVAQMFDQIAAAVQ
jgi:polysaccharide pyruvyl transferase WcaK-like protein